MLTFLYSVYYVMKRKDICCCFTCLTTLKNEMVKNGNGKRYILSSFPDTPHQANGKAITERDIHHENQEKEEERYMVKWRDNGYNEMVEMEKIVGTGKRETDQGKSPIR